jgi:hypothetical protein
MMATKKHAEPAPAAKPVKKAAARKAATPAKKAATPKAVPAKKTAAPTKPGPAKPGPAPSATKHPTDLIARAAYLNYRRRVEQGLPGDSHGDWLEAERYVSGKRES